MIPEQRHYATKRRVRYLGEIGVATQIAAIIDELLAIRDKLGNGYNGAASFDALLARINAIKSAIPPE